MLRTINILGIILSVLLLVGCESVGPLTGQTNTSESATAPATDRGEYRFGIADQLRVTIFGEPELSGEFVIDGQGRVSMPLIGEVSALGQTLRSFQADVQARYANGYLREPSLSVEVLNFRPFYILGEVNRPGEYPYGNGLTVLNAIATAEGYTYRANKRVVLIKSADEAEERRVDLTPTLRICLLYTSPSPRDRTRSRMPSSA